VGFPNQKPKVTRFPVFVFGKKKTNRCFYQRCFTRFRHWFVLPPWWGKKKTQGGAMFPVSVAGGDFLVFAEKTFGLQQMEFFL